MQKIRRLNPDIVPFSSLAISETQMCVMKRKELGIKAPFMYSGGYGADPSLRQIGTDFLEGNICYAAFFPHKLTPKDWIDRSLAQCRKEYSDEPWMGQELGFPWTMIPIMAAILEKAGSRDRQAILRAGRELDIHDVSATRALPEAGNRIRQYRTDSEEVSESDRRAVAEGNTGHGLSPGTCTGETRLGEINAARGCTGSSPCARRAFLQARRISREPHALLVAG